MPLSVERSALAIHPIDLIGREPGDPFPNISATSIEGLDFDPVSALRAFHQQLPNSKMMTRKESYYGVICLRQRLCFRDSIRQNQFDHWIARKLSIRAYSVAGFRSGMPTERRHYA